MTFKPFDEVEAARADRKARQSFYTPMTYVRMICEDLPVVGRVLEPSAGDGRFIHVLREVGFEQVDACEIDTAAHARCAELGANMVGQDFLAYRPGPVYDWIVMNPPFSKGQDAKHLAHAYSLLRPGGQIRSIASLGLAPKLIEQQVDLPGCVSLRWEELDREKFGHAQVKTIYVTIDKPGPGDCHNHDGYETWATYNAATLVANERKSWEWCQDWCRRHPVDVEKAAVVFHRQFKNVVKFTYGVDWGDVYLSVLPEELRDELNAKRPVGTGDTRPATGSGGIGTSRPPGRKGGGGREKSQPVARGQRRPSVVAEEPAGPPRGLASLFDL